MELESFSVFLKHYSEALNEGTKTGEYKGRKVTLEKPFRLGKDEKKKFGVYVKSDKGNVILVKFGAKGYRIKKDNPEARKNFRARHNCDSATDKTKSSWWSCHWSW
jgi:hypothetical protein